MARFSPEGYNEGDMEFPVSVWAYARLKDFARDRGIMSVGHAGRILVTRLLTHARFVKWDLSKLEFSMGHGATDRSLITRTGVDPEDVTRLCKAGWFGPEELLEVALSLQGVKETA
ncbi:hypothetical protein AX768_07030 [Burkholderia sp. PAMC 28687]|nr:hypothetical protein AX768_07030 [Burkholderia sp. PAMC 28687]